MVQVVFYQNNTGSTTIDALEDWYDDSLNDVKITNFRKKYISYQLPISYRTPKTCANDAAADVQLQNTGCITKNALGERYDDFVKHEKMWIFRKNRLRISPLDPTERYKHVQTMIQVVFYKKTRRKMICGVGIAKKSQIGSKWTFYMPASHPIPYRILKTRANDDISDIRPKTHGYRAELCSGGTVDQKIVKNEKFALCNVSHHPPRPYRTPKTRSKDGKSGLLPKNTGSTMKDTLGKRRLKNLKA